MTSTLLQSLGTPVQPVREFAPEAMPELIHRYHPPIGCGDVLAFEVPYDAFLLQLEANDIGHDDLAGREVMADGAHVFVGTPEALWRAREQCGSLTTALKLNAAMQGKGRWDVITEAEWNRITSGMGNSLDSTATLA